MISSFPKTCNNQCFEFIQYFLIVQSYFTLSFIFILSLQVEWVQFTHPYVLIKLINSSFHGKFKYYGL